MKKGYSVFGKAYETMLKNDLHNLNSIDHKLLREMILLEEDSYQALYGIQPLTLDMKTHDLYDFSQSLRDNTDLITIKNVLDYTSKIAGGFSLKIEEMKFGGTEKEILERGTDWCADMARVSVVLLMCLGISARIIYLANTERAYNGHVVTEAYYEGKFGVIDPIYGYCFHDGKPLDAYMLMNENKYLKDYDDAYRGLFKKIAICEYNPLDAENDYSVSVINDYYRILLNNNHDGKWLLGENQ